MRFLGTLLAVLLLSGCSIFPSSWSPFRTPAEKADRAVVKQEQAEYKVLGAVQEELHKTTAALDVAQTGNQYAIPVAQTHAKAARSLVDQALGAPTLPTEQKWAELVKRQTSLDDSVRQIAEKENAKRLEQIGKLSNELQSKDAALSAANEKAVESAKELQGFKDFVLKIAWVVGGLFALYFLGQFLQLLANFNPAFGTAANAVNAFVSPALHAAAYKARKAAQAFAGPVPPSQ